MKTATEQITDLITLTQHSNDKYRNNLSSKYTKKLVLLLKAIRDIIRVGYDPDNTTLKNKAQLQKKITAELKSGLEKIYEELNTELNEFMSASNAMYTDQLKSVFKPVKDFLQIKSVSDEDIIKAYNKDYMTFDKSGSHTVSSIWATFSSRLNTIVKQTVNQAYVLDESLSDFESEIYGTTANTNVSKSNLDAVVSSLVAFGFSRTIKGVNQANSHILSGYTWDAILDSATTQFCWDLAGKYWLYDAPEKSTLPYEIYAPAHYNCRTVNPPITMTYEELGIDPEDLTIEQRELLGVYEPSTTTSYSKFIESQPVFIQKEMLGEVRYSMWKSGEIQISQFYTRDGRKYTLKQLQEKGYEVSEQYLQYVRS